MPLEELTLCCGSLCDILERCVVLCDEARPRSQLTIWPFEKRCVGERAVLGDFEGARRGVEGTGSKANRLCEWKVS